jgi:hypothetical protein
LRPLNHSLARLAPDFHVPPKFVRCPLADLLMLQTDVTPLASYVGFDSITSQIERKLLKRGFQFNIICVGAF